MRKKKYYEIRKFKKKMLYCTKRRYSQMKPQIKVEKEDRREAQYKKLS